jgi:hypothetical protein
MGPLLRQLVILFVEAPILGIACLLAGVPQGAYVIVAAAGWACAAVDIEQLELRGVRKRAA